jgi:hypothetical protein
MYSGERETARFERSPHRIDDEPETLECMCSEERQTVRPGEQDQRERSPIPVANLDPGCRLFSPSPVGEDDRDSPVGSDAESREQSIGKLRERGSGIDQAFHLGPPVRGRCLRANFHLD